MPVVTCQETSNHIHTLACEETSKHTHTVIFLHGRDSDAEEFMTDFFESEASEPAGKPRTLPDLFPGIRWVFPEAPILHSKRFDTMMSQWFDIWSVEEPEEKVEIQMEGLNQSISCLLEVIKTEEKLVPRQNIFLGGISQGFATALSTFFAAGGNFAGLVGLCSWMPFADAVDNLKKFNLAGDHLFTSVHKIYFGQKLEDEEQSLSRSFRSTPVFLAHSADDSVVPIESGKRMRNALMRLHLNTEFHEYKDGGHWINEEQGVDDMAKFLSHFMWDRFNMDPT